MRRFLPFLLLFAGCFSMFAQKPLRPVISAYMLEGGSSHVACTYLSPLKQSGWMTALTYERMQAMRFNPEKWVMQLGGRLSGGRTLPRYRNAPIWDLNLNLNWGMLWRYRPADGWQLAVGGYTDLDLGVLYAPRNSNNPASAKASWTIGPRVAAIWNFKAWKKLVRLRYQAEMPLTGVFFAPEYGELYYEIYLGNHKGLAHMAYPGNFFRLRNFLSADITFGSTTLRLGYRCDVGSSKVNNLVNNSISHMAVIGIVSEWISLSPNRRPNVDSKIISALY